MDFSTRHAPTKAAFISTSPESPPVWRAGWACVFHFIFLTLRPAKKFVQKNSRRLLLREAVQRAEAPDQIHGVNAGDGTVFEQFTQNAGRDAVVA
jgi:hypothetical protein